MPDREPESISSYMLTLVGLAQRQLESLLGFQEAIREHVAHTDARFTQAADMFVQLAGWVRGQGEEIVRTNERLAVTNERLLATEERIEQIERRIERLLRALLRGRGNGEGTQDQP